MKTIKLSSLLAFLFFALASCDQSAPEVKDSEEKEEKPSSLDGSYMVNTEKSTLKWKGSMLEVGGVSLYSHHGDIKIAKGEINAKEGRLSSGSVIVDMTTINPQDDGYKDEDGRRAEDLVGHLSSDDFFNVEEHPTARLNITGMADGKVSGKMTIRGNEKDIAIEEVEMKESEDGMMHAKGKFSFDRQEFGAKFKIPAQDKVLSDRVRMEFEIYAEKSN